MSGPLLEEFGLGGKDSMMLAMEFPIMLERMHRRTLNMREKPHQRKSRKPQVEI
jgi:hypothetical protein